MKDKYKFIASDIFKTISRVIVKGLVTGVIMEIAERFGVPLSSSFDYEQSHLCHPHNATQQAIKGIHDCAVDAAYDSYKVKAGNRIVSVMEKACPDDDTKQYAIMALESLIEECVFTSSSDRICEMIETIAAIKPVKVVSEQ